MTTFALDLASSSGVKSSTRFSALSGPSTGSSDPFDEQLPRLPARVYLVDYAAQEPHGRVRRGECLDYLRSALELAVHSFLNVTGADFDAVLPREREVRERVDPGLLEHSRGGRGEHLELFDRLVVERPHERGPVSSKNGAMTARARRWAPTPSILASTSRLTCTTQRCQAASG